VREKYRWLVADKPSEQPDGFQPVRLSTAALHIVSSRVWSDMLIGFRRITMPKTTICVLFCV
jgi:hypothetical protein